MRAVPIILAILLCASFASANRYGNASYLKPFPPSEVKGAYEFSPNSQFHYAVPYAAAAVRYAALKTHAALGPAVVPPVICDVTTANGDTPAGRHPGGSHDGGINLDITYYMRRLTPGMIVCPSNANAHCTGPATDLDAERQAYFFNVLSALNAEYGNRLIQKAAVDNEVHAAMVGNLRTDIRSVVYSENVDLDTGWFRFHHNHFHLRAFWRPAEAACWEAEINSKIRALLSPSVSSGGGGQSLFQAPSFETSVKTPRGDTDLVRPPGQQQVSSTRKPKRPRPVSPPKPLPPRPAGYMAFHWNPKQAACWAAEIESKISALKETPS